jgi:hypothetical protein
VGDLVFYKNEKREGVKSNPTVRSVSKMRVKRLAYLNYEKMMISSRDVPSFNVDMMSVYFVDIYNQLLRLQYNRLRGHYGGNCLEWEV